MAAGDVKLSSLKFSYTKDGYAQLTANFKDKWGYDKSVIHEFPETYLTSQICNSLIDTVIKEVRDWQT